MSGQLLRSRMARIPARSPLGREVAVQWEHWRRLAWLYGPERADSIIDGLDEATNADLAAWRNLGREA